MSKSIYGVAAFAGSVAIVVIVVAWVSFINTEDVEIKGYILLVQVTVVFLVGMVTAVVSLAAANLQIKNAQRIEEHGRLVGISQEELVVILTQSVQQSVNAATEELNTRLEQVMPQRYEAYHAMWKAATEYSMALKKLELGEYPEQQIKEAEKTRNVSFTESLLATPEDVEEYYSLMQEALYIQEKAEDIKTQSEPLKQLWRENGPGFGRHYEKLRERFRNRLLAGT